MKLRNSLPSKDRAAPVAEGGCTQRVGVGHSSPGTTCSPSQGAQTHNCTLNPSRLQSPVLLLFSLLNSIILVVLFSLRACSLESLEDFSSVAPIHCPVSIACGDLESSGFPQCTPEHGTRSWRGAVFWHLCCLQPFLPIADVHSCIFMKHLQLLGP